MNKKFRKLILPASLLIASQSFALGLGGLQIDSSLDEVLNAEIPFIIDSSEEIESIEVSVASFAEYEKVNLDKSYVPTNIQVGVIERNGQKYVQVSSVGPVSEPIVSLLLVVDWSNGRLLREYTILLDPPLFNNTQTNEYSKPVETNTYVTPQQIENQSQPATQASRQISASNYTGSSQIVVESGDTLWRIASRYNDGSSPQQMMVAIFNNNSEAFLNDDMNQLRKGAVLTIPDSDQVSIISNSQAVSEVRSHTQNWLRTQNEDSSLSSNNTSTTDYGIELVPPSDSDSSDSYGASGTSTSARVNTKTIADLNRAKEQLVSSNLENSELSGRVNELEKIIEDQKLALSLKDSDLAQLQEMLKEDGETDSTSLDVMSDTSSDTMSDTMSDTPSDTMTTDDVWDEMQPDSAEMSDISGSESMDDTNSEMMDDSEMVDEMMHEDSMEESMEDSMEDSMDSETSDASDAQPAVTEPIKKEPSLLEKIMQYKFEGLIGLGALLLGLLGFVFFKRRGDNDSSDTGGFLDSISNNNSDGGGDSDGDLDDFNSSLDSNSTELDLTNLEDFDDSDNLEGSELSEVTQQGENLSEEGLEEAPEVVVMNDSDGELNDDLDELDLDLEFGLDDDLESSPESSEQTNNDSENTEMEFNLEEDLSEGQEEKDSEDLSLDFELDDLDLDDESSDEFEFDLDFDASSDDLEKVTDDTEERTIVDAVETIDDEVQEVADVDNGDLPDLEFDMSDDLFDTDDLDLELDSESDSDAIEKDDVTELNLETLDEEDLSLEFNLDNSDDIEESDEVESNEDVDIGLDFDDLASDDAIDTKLDLAKAYFEMGDVDGAQQMVNEIIEEGNDEQKSKAKNLKIEIEGS